MTGDIRKQLDPSHHSVVRRVGDMVEIVRPLRDTSWWHRWKAERACRKTLGHCWHVGGFVDWWCCACSAETDGMPAQECKICAQAAAFWLGTPEVDR